MRVHLCGACRPVIALVAAVRQVIHGVVLVLPVERAAEGACRLEGLVPRRVQLQQLLRQLQRLLHGDHIL